MIRDFMLVIWGPSGRWLVYRAITNGALIFFWYLHKSLRLLTGATPRKQRSDHFFMETSFSTEMKKTHIIQELDVFILDIKTFYQDYADEDSTTDDIITLIKAWDVGIISIVPLRLERNIDKRIYWIFRGHDKDIRTIKVNRYFICSSFSWTRPEKFKFNIPKCSTVRNFSLIFIPRKEINTNISIIFLHSPASHFRPHHT